MTPISAAKAKELLDAATPGPWRMQTAACDHGDADEHTAIKGGGALVVACVEDTNAALIAAAPDLAATVVALEAERDAALDFIRREGYRRCDIAACNCGSWHGGYAGDRLHEIREVLDDAGEPGGVPIRERVRAVLIDRDAAREAGREEIRAAHRTPPSPPTVPKVCDTCGRTRLVFADSPAALPDAPFECSRCSDGN